MSKVIIAKNLDWQRQPNTRTTSIVDVVTDGEVEDRIAEHARHSDYADTEYHVVDATEKIVRVKVEDL